MEEITRDNITVQMKENVLLSKNQFGFINNTSAIKGNRHMDGHKRWIKEAALI